MGKKLPIFYNALLLTGVNLLLRFMSTSFQVYLSGRIGAAGIGLLQLVMSVGMLALTVGMGGIRTATMYLSAEVRGQKRTKNMIWVLSGCIIYSIILSSTVGILLYLFAPQIAAVWIGDDTTVGALRLLAGFLPVNCLCGVMIGYFTGVNRIGTLAAVEVAEQLFSMLSTILLLTFWAGSSAAKACLSVVMSSGMGACFTLLVLLFLKRNERMEVGARISVRKKLWETAVPLAIADNTKAGISTTENLMVPKRMALYPGETNPLAVFGMVCGMVFPVLMFPAAILFGLAELLIPELARCKATGSSTRIQHLVERSLLLAVVYGTFCGAILFVAADELCLKLYHAPAAGKYLRWFTILAPMLYCDAIVDAMIKGLGKQKICVRYNIITSAMDVALLFILLPKFGIIGYFISFLVTHLLNFLLSIRQLFKLVGSSLHCRTSVLCILSAVCGVIATQQITLCLWACIVCGFIYIILLILFNVVQKRDFVWLKGLVKSKMQTP